MKSSLRLLAFLCLTFAASAFAAEPSTTAPAAEPAKPKTFLIVLQLTPKYQVSEAWTKEADAVVSAHFTRLQEALARGEVILAGRTEESLDKTMGLVVFTAADENAAREFLEGDPCVTAGIMRGTVHPYSIALIRQP